MGIEIALAVIVLGFVSMLMRTFRIVPQARVGIIQRLGNYHRSADSGRDGRYNQSAEREMLDPRSPVRVGRRGAGIFVDSPERAVARVE